MFTARRRRRKSSSLPPPLPETCFPTAGSRRKPCFARRERRSQVEPSRSCLGTRFQALRRTFGGLGSEIPGCLYKNRKFGRGTMAPRRGDVVEERRDGESMELGGRMSELEGKIGALDGRVASLEERLTALDDKFEKGFSSLEALIRSSGGTQAQASNEKGKGPLPNPNSEVYRED